MNACDVKPHVPVASPPPPASKNYSNATPSRVCSALTPQRKHRKMLKDGSSEVWPESVERIFVEGLREYWDSPYASFSRGRSRWRNQFLVEYLGKAGIHRSKKQVASHIQVLRNMWKGEPEYNLVAGGDELLLETGGLPDPSSAGEGPTSSSIPVVKQESGHSFSLSSPSTSSSSDSDFMFDAQMAGRPHFHAQRPGTDASSPPYFMDPLSPARGRSYDSVGRNLSVEHEGGEIFFAAQPHIRPGLSGPSFQQTAAADSWNRGAAELYRINAASDPYGGQISTAISPPPHRLSPPVKVEPAPVDLSTGYGRTTSPSSPPMNASQPKANRITGLCIGAEGMAPFPIDVDGWAQTLGGSVDHEAVTLQIRLTFSSRVENMYSSPTSSGFDGIVYLALPWVRSAQCTTTVYVDGASIHEEAGALNSMSSTDDGVVTASLPESWLGRSKWLDATRRTYIIQRIVVDDNVLGIVQYELNRKDGGGAPSAEVIDFQVRKYDHPGKSPNAAFSPARVPYIVGSPRHPDLQRQPRSAYAHSYQQQQAAAQPTINRFDTRPFLEVGTRHPSAVTSSATRF